MINNIISKVLCRIFRVATVPGPAEPTASEMKFISELRSRFLEFPVLKTDTCLPSEKEWFDNINVLRDKVLVEDPRNFLRWDVIKRTMLVENSNYVNKELEFIKGLPDWKERWRHAIKETGVGAPIPYWRYPESSENLIHHAYHVAKFENINAQSIHGTDFIFEFGGGYGSLCRLLFNVGFTGKYVIFDFPAFSALQRFFLNSVGIEVFPAELFSEKQKGVFCVSDMEQLKAILHSAQETKNSMFIATWSISETSVGFRSTILPLLASFRNILIGYQERFGEVDNIGYFEQFRESREDIVWNNSAIAHVPGNYYLMGKARDSR